MVEVLPKPVYYGRTAEADFIRRYFAHVSRWVGQLDEIVSLATQQAERFGLSAMDALHVAAALLDSAEEFITTERPNAPIHRITGIRIVSIYPSR